MLVEKKTTVKGRFAKAGEDFHDGDVIVISDEGEWVEGEWGKRLVVKIHCLDGEDKNLTINQTSVNFLVDAYGPDTKDWVNKEVKTWILKQNISGKLRNVVYLTSPEANLEELM